MKIHKLLYEPENLKDQQITRRISEIVYYTKKSKKVYELACNVVFKLTKKDISFVVKFRDEQQFNNSEFISYVLPNHWEDDQSFYLGKNVIIDESSLRPQGIKLLEELYEIVERENKNEL